MSLKFALIGGGGLRTPLLMRGLLASKLPVREVSLYDVDSGRLGHMSRLCSAFAGEVPIRVAASSAECVRNADYVFFSIRVGGMAARARDEVACLARGLPGQETVGPGGFAMALRTIPEAVRYATEIAQLAPRAWVVNFTNPVGMVTQALLSETRARIIGICDTPTELFEEVALALGLPSPECRFDYFGLNHLGWLREVYYQGRPRLGQAFEDPSLLARLYRAPLFEPAFLQRLGLLPTEYLYYYYRPKDAVANLKAAGKTRGQTLEEKNAKLLADLAGARNLDEGTHLYDRYLDSRNRSYMQLESGQTRPLPPTAASAVTGYDRIALAVVQSIHFDKGDTLPLDVRNGSTLPMLEPTDSVEVPCVVNASGALPLPVDPVPTSVLPLVQAVKEYERLTVRAALTRSKELALEALSKNPLVESREQAQHLLKELTLPW